MPLLEYRALLLEEPAAPAPQPEPVPVRQAAGAAVIPRPEPLPVNWTISGGAHLRISAGGTITVRRAPDIYELVLEDII